MNSYAFGVAALLFALPSTAKANDSVYSDLNLDACQTVHVEEGISITLKCAGPKGYPFYFKEGDLRQTVLFGHMSPAYVDQAFETFGTFNHTGTKAEWRLDGDGRAIAVILRYFLEHSDPKTGMPAEQFWGQVLVVSRIAQKDYGKGCMAAFVDARANKDANGLARQLADTLAPSFACGTDQAVYHGKRGATADDLMSNLP
ncbi:hypothetical protein [Rhizobium sp. CG5]|uniref:hypothetical protein n=1 Tax=Rhizobium sp. CG5 TaxID=2726076 RepID=UPI0020342E81|nr:hypothetical protein [Rhizobium sp. CG5]